jgi:tRNA threonylcarbamoyladenosine biosynthesis protein TsaB
MHTALAIETSSRIGSVAVVDDGRVGGEEEFPYGLAHAAQIVVIIDRLPRACGWGPGDIDELYVSAGPGSFTGLRIGITLAKTMALARGVKLAAVPTMRVLAENAPAEARHLVLVLDAKREQIYTARFERVDGKWEQREEAQVEALADALARAPRPVHLLGEGIPYHRKFVAADEQVIVTAEALWRPRAAVVARLGYEMARRGEFADADHLTPIYIRRPEAEEKWAAGRVRRDE